MLAAESFVRSGKVRDLYEVGPDRLLLVASDRMSAFDVVLPTEIPDKGRVLTGLSRFWFDKTAAIVPNQVIGTDPAALPGDRWGAAEREELRGRMVIARRASVLPVELVVRGFLSGSGWKEYRRHGAVCGVELPTGLRESDRLPEPIFTPAVKATSGHDENISYAEMVKRAGPKLSEQLRDISITLYKKAAEHAAGRGIIIADTKFEFGTTAAGLVLADEVLTPDSSRFWPANKYRPGGPQDSFDKQYVRDYLESIRWNKQPPAPSLPAEVAAKTSEKYMEAYRILTGRELEI
jgi:phosphoribosylaminoimidazole-succinocarboxamide synthase